MTSTFFKIARKVRWYVFSPPGPERDGVEGDEAEGEPEGKGEPPRGVIGVLGAGLVSLIRGDGRDMSVTAVYRR
jgi:hypothetical protein